MKPFKQFREECGCEKKEKKVKSKLKNKKSGNVEVMPNIPDGQKGMTTNATNEAKNYEGPLYAPWSDVVKGRGFDPITERAKSKSQQRFFGMVRATQKGEMEGGSSEVSKAATSMSKSDVKDFAKTKHKKLPEKVTAKEESNPRTLVKKVMQKDSEKKRKNALLIQKVIGASRKLKGNFIDEGHYGKEVNKIPKELDKAVALHKSQAERLRASDEFKKDAGKNANKIPDQLDKSVAMHKKQAKQLRDAGVGEKNCGCGQTPCKTYGQKSVKEDKGDHEPEMIRNQLKTAKRASKTIKKHTHKKDNFKAWVQSKITKASDYLDTAADYLDSKEVKEESNPRIPRKKGQPANSKKHSDLYTDENPKGTIHGLGFKDVETAKASVSKIRNSSRSHAHKIQAAVAMEQRAREMGKTSEAAVYRKFINTMKKKTKKMKESFAIDPKSHRQQQRSAKIRNLAKKGATEGERSAAERKTKGPKMFGETAYYKQDASYQKKLSDEDKANKEKDARIKHGKNWKKFTSDVDSAKNRLRKGEVKKFNKQTGKWESNKD